MYGVASNQEEPLPYQYNTGTAFEVSIFTDEDKNMNLQYDYEPEQQKPQLQRGDKYASSSGRPEDDRFSIQLPRFSFSRNEEP